MFTGLKVVTLVALMIASLAYGLPVAVKNIAETPLSDYVVFFTVDRELLLSEGISNPASMCAISYDDEILPLWVVPETLEGRSVAVYVRIPYIAPGDHYSLKLSPGPCVQNPFEVFIFYDDFKVFNTKFWTPLATPQIYNITVKGGAIAGKGLYISGTYMAPNQYIQILSQTFPLPLIVETLVTPLTAYDHDACLDLREHGTEGAHPAEARGAYIHAWGWGVSGQTEARMGRFTWYRLAGPSGSSNYYWDMTTWNDGGPSPVFNANETFLFRIGVGPWTTRYEVWQLRADEGLVKLLTHSVDLGVENDVVIALGQGCGGSYNFTQKAVFHWVLVRQFAWPQPRIAVGAERVEESPLSSITEFLSKPTNLILASWSVIVVVLVIVVISKVKRKSW
ncbi:MAG: DUF2341 domain-containing protein [Thermofilaceae archaeon]|nr:DUF2341 domain-containing protein [Thermofilaceae archaeon]